MACAPLALAFLTTFGNAAATALEFPICDNSPFHHLAVHYTPPPLPPNVCPIDGAPIVSDEFVSFQEWKSRQIQSNVVVPEENDSFNNLIVAPSPSTISPGSILGGTLASLPSALVFTQPRVPLTDRFNFASPDCKARVHSAHPQPKKSHASSILSSKKDKYMLSPCSTVGKFVVVELCDDIKVR
jgi:hypothetical protein